MLQNVLVSIYKFKLTQKFPKHYRSSKMSYKSLQNNLQRLPNALQFI